MKAVAEPDFFLQDYITTSPSPKKSVPGWSWNGGSEQAESILQQTGGFLDASGIGRGYHRLPHGLPVEQQRLKATSAPHALLAAGHSVHLDPALNILSTPDSEREATLRYLSQLAARAYRAARAARRSPKS